MSEFRRKRKNASFEEIRTFLSSVYGFDITHLDKEVRDFLERDMKNGILKDLAGTKKGPLKRRKRPR